MSYHLTMTVIEEENRTPRKSLLIQSYRAIAIILVLLFHLDIVLKYGFLGVDIFFVISGFVITQNVINEIGKKNSFNFWKFLTRRVLRIFPTLAAMSIAIGILSLFTQTALQPLGQQQVTAKTGLGGLVFMDNILIPRLSSGYFGVLAQENSMTHLWSISIEFQFYILFAFAALVLAYSTGFLKRFLVILSIIVFIVSAIFCLSQDNDVVFFSLFARAWEFGIGIGIAFLVIQARRRNLEVKYVSKEMLLFLGISAIFVSQMYLFEYPFKFRLITSIIGIGVLLIASQMSGLSRLGYLLSLPPIVNVGNISYSLYLIHWPFIVMVSPFLQDRALGKLILITSCLVLASASYHYIELRFHYSSHGLRRLLIRTLSLYLVAVLFLIGIGIGAKQNWGKETYGLTNPFVAIEEKCSQVEVGFPNCFIPGPKNAKTLMVVGDSQAAADSDAFISYGRLHGLSTLIISRNGGPLTDARCKQNNCNDALMLAIKQVDPDYLVVANLWNLPDDTVYKEQRITEEFLKPLISWTKQNNVQFILVSPLPVLGAPGKYYSILNSQLIKQELFVPEFIPSQRQVDGIFKKSEYVQSFKLLDPKLSLCKTQLCAAIDDGLALYRDKTHLSRFGAKKLIEQVSKLLG
jgi:peptidoglycan/LPS O-acetylase OafA/YrhL